MSNVPTVLIVDDERAITNLHARWLENSYNIKKAYNGTEALEQIDKSVDIVLLDRRMPDLSGQEVLNEIRDQEIDCRVAMVTAVEPDFDILELGFDDYICKPVSNPEQLHNVVSSLRTRSTYDTQLQEMLALSTKKAALEERKKTDELTRHSEYADLKARLESLRNDLSETVEGLDNDDLRAEFQDRNTANSKLVQSSEQNDASEFKN
ncbi:HalX domain-containing protein [Haladaptatus litoreus]|uniref:HalX domain-containing protein n=1 Tax=Haladaptatus litoreus TaxID=553468 RepID=A0A1N7D973_9EURY|nr:response regulator [Haladaptatus litoreus]SIR72307.1 HalX domain-containing protein [Haladaptatus litoreus]